MEILGKIKKILELQNFASGFRKRELVILTEDQYPQHILIEFLQEKTNLLNGLNIDDYVNISINLRGREWINNEGIIKYLTSIQGWRIKKIKRKNLTPYISTYSNTELDDFYHLPF